MWRKQKQCQYKSGRGCTTGFVLRVWAGKRSICALAVMGKCLLLLEAFRIEKMRTPGTICRGIVPPYLVENIEEQN